MALLIVLPTFVSLLCGLTMVKSQWIDMSYVYDNTTISWGDATKFQHKVIVQGKVSNEIPYLSMFDIETAEHAGTHLDAPIHFSKGKWAVDQIPPEKFIGDAVVVNISVKASKDRNAVLTVDDLTKWEEENGAIPDDSILFVFTGWGKYWPDYEKYMGTATTNTSLYRFPGIHQNASQWLVDNRKVEGVGIDTASIDYGKSHNFISHQILFSKNIYGLENVANLDKLPSTGATIYAFPMKVGDGSGAPVRIMASINKKTEANSGGISSFSVFVLVILAVPFFMYM